MRTNDRNTGTLVLQQAAVAQLPVTYSWPPSLFAASRPHACGSTQLQVHSGPGPAGKTLNPKQYPLPDLDRPLRKVRAVKKGRGSLLDLRFEERCEKHLQVAFCGGLRGARLLQLHAPLLRCFQLLLQLLDLG